jgi:hypothetical protein
MTCCCSAEVPGTDAASSTPLQNCTSLRGSDGAPVMLVMLLRTAATSGCVHSQMTWYGSSVGAEHSVHVEDRSLAARRHAVNAGETAGRGAGGRPLCLPRPFGRAIGVLEAGDVQVEGLLSVPVVLSGGEATRACTSGAAIDTRHARDGCRLGAPPPLRVRTAGGVTHGLSVAMLASRSDEASMSSSVSSVESGEKYPWRPEGARRGAALGAWRGGGMRAAGASG